MHQILLSICILNFQADAGMVRVSSATDEGCEFSISVAPPSFREFMGYWYPTIGGMGLSLPEGGYVSPSRTYFVPLPPGCMPEMTCSASGFNPVDFPGQPLVAPVHNGTGLDTEWFVPEEAVQPYNEGFAELDTMHIAGITVAAVTVEPFQWMNGTGAPSRLNIRLSWPAQAGSRPLDNPLLEALCLAGTEYWPAASGSRETSPFWGYPWARIAISATGPYVVSCQELEQAGCNAQGAPVNSLRMFTGPGRQFRIDIPEESHSLTEMAIEVTDDGDGIFNGSDSLIFFGESLNRFHNKDGMISRYYHRYATHNVYWLTWGGENGLRADTLNSIPDGSPAWGDSLIHSSWQEQNYIWQPDEELRTGWVWSILYEDIPGYFYFSSSSQDGDGLLTVSLVASTSGLHEVTFVLNNEVLADTSWVGRTERIFQFDGLTLDPSMNLLKVTTTNDPGSVYFNYFMVQYPRRLNFAANRILRFPAIPPHRYTLSLGGAGDSYSLLDITDTYSPRRLHGSLLGTSLTASLDVDLGCQLWLVGTEGYLSPDSILPSEPGRIIGSGIEADVAVVVADQLMDVVDPIQVIYDERGLSTAIVSASEVYNEFGQGIRDPGAIRSFFRFTQDNWENQAQAVLLVGDGSYDPLMHVTATPTLIPAYITLGSVEGYPIDDLYVIAHVGGAYPEVPLSRITASTQAELSLYLNKVMLYEAMDTPGQWTNRILLVADDEWGSSSTSETRHTEACEVLADSILPQSLERDKFYLIEYPWPPGTAPGGEHPEKPEAREDLITELGRGCANMIFFGHGSYGQIAHEKLLVSSDVDRIENGRRQPVLIIASCNCGQFDLISAKCLAEDFVMMPDGGSILSIAATRGTLSGNNEYLFNEYFSYLFGSDDLSAGDCLWLGKVTGLGSYGNDRLYVALGDGGVRSVFPSDDGCSFEVSGDTLRRGVMNSVTAEFTGSSSAFLKITESGMNVVYNCLGGGELPYLKYGSAVYQSIIPASNNHLEMDFFMPLQADTGSYSRGSALGISTGESESAWREWVSVIDDGIHSDDSLPPAIELWIRGHRGDGNPTVSGNSVLRAVLSDSSGIAAMGGGAGRSILMSLDSQGFDISSYFTYQPGSYTTGDIEYPLPELADGSHRLILAAWDGMGNSARDTLDFTSVASSSDLLHSVFVYPNPGSGERCFNFTTSEAGNATIAIYTVAGRMIWSKEVSCNSGYNQVMWNGRDADGDFPASGPYIFSIDFRGSGSSSSRITEVLAVLRRGS